MSFPKLVLVAVLFMFVCGKTVPLLVYSGGTVFLFQAFNKLQIDIRQRPHTDDRPQQHALHQRTDAHGLQDIA